MPNLPEPISASPDSLSRMRRYFTPAASGSRLRSLDSPSAPTPFRLPSPPFPLRLATVGCLPVASLGLSRLFLDLGSEVVGSLLEPLAHLEAHEAPHPHVLARLGDEIGQQRADVLLAL